MNKNIKIALLMSLASLGSMILWFLIVIVFLVAIPDQNGAFLGLMVSSGITVVIFSEAISKIIPEYVDSFWKREEEKNAKKKK